MKKPVVESKYFREKSVSSENKKCPDHKYCCNSRKECTLHRAADCIPSAKVEASSVLYVCMISRILERGNFQEDDSIYLFHKNLYLDSGGKEKRINSILEAAMNSYNMRKEMNSVPLKI